MGSCNLLIALSSSSRSSCNNNSNHAPPALLSYEALGRQAYGRWGEWAVMVSKGLYAFGSMVACLFVLLETWVDLLLTAFSNSSSSMTTTPLPVAVEGSDAAAFTMALAHESGEIPHANNANVLAEWSHHLGSTWMICLVLILPLSLLREARALEQLS
eukprot:CAMPEP_0172464574 /NCGR_PEP_ID=MMETSP1065-20121228/50868_1 /TAXON_ID=265537 /ORGANISM="Amphiprora paludosa, Strain CCMP125" /LENGTH=157 /DNA_ID=CAMNT_0013220845 /DNA_START=20 /DNA_END=489 /DNA_ORIENTATION=+